MSSQISFDAQLTADGFYMGLMRLARLLREGRSADSPGFSRLGILARLGDEGAATATALAEHLRLQPQSMTRLLSALERDGLITRRADESDQRRILIAQTAKGKRVLENESSKRREALARAMEGALTPTELELLRIVAPILERLADSVTKHDGSGVAESPAANEAAKRPVREQGGAETRFMRSQISMITLGVADLKRSIEFYRDGLGFPTRVEPGAPIAFFSTSGARFSLCPLDRLAEFIGCAAIRPPEHFSGFTLGHCVREKSEVDRVINLAARAGAQIVKPPQRVFWGGYSGVFTDPDGFYWEVTWSAAYRWDDGGNLVV